jgi:acyl phosphate:glycerol-3-phosphate acyltransferase
MNLVLTAVMSYFLGSIPFGYLLVRLFHGKDVRQTGSGNIGATNVSRTSPALGAITLLLDAVKGMAAVILTRIIFPDHNQIQLSAVAALFAIAGHIFPVWLKFRGGKGVATGLGSFALLAPKAVLVVLGIFVGVVLAFRYVSLGSIIAFALFPLLAGLLDGHGERPETVLIMVVAAALIILKHRENVRRIMTGKENRFQLRRG